MQKESCIYVLFISYKIKEFKIIISFLGKIKGLVVLVVKTYFYDEIRNDILWKSKIKKISHLTEEIEFSTVIVMKGGTRTLFRYKLCRA
jgi:hypothetical protein